MAKLFLRVEMGEGARLGPGKIELLEHIRDTGSISAAGRMMKMSYKRAWMLADSLNHAFRQPVVAAQHGGKAGGGASLTPFGADVIARYRRVEADAARAFKKHLAALEDELNETPAAPAARAKAARTPPRR